MAGREKLNEHHRAFLVRAFACYSGPAEAVKGLHDAFGIDITVQGAQHYDADSLRGKQKLAQKWQEMFARTREAFLEDVVKTVPYAEKSVRIKELADAAKAFKEHNNFMAMAKMLEQIAKEVGNVHTNRHELTGRDGAPIKFQDVGDMTDEQIKEELERLGWVGVDVDVHPAPKTKQ